MYFNIKILAQFAKTKIMMIGKILNTDKIDLIFKQNMSDKKASSF